MRSAKNGCNLRASYGLFPCQSDGDELIVYNPGYHRHCLAGRTDALHLPAPTLRRSSLPCRLLCSGPIGQDGCGRVPGGDSWARKPPSASIALQAKGDYSEAYFTHGLAVQTAEARQIICMTTCDANWASAKNRASAIRGAIRPSRTLEDHQKVFQLLPAASHGTWHEPLVRLSAHPGAIHRRDHCPSQECQILQRRRIAR